jgi:predicted nucleotidyltransferase
MRTFSIFYGILIQKFWQAFEQHRAEIRQIVERHRASNARVFGSVLHREDNDESDLGLLVERTST